MEIYKCRYCGGEFSSLRSKASHEIRCPHNHSESAKYLRESSLRSRKKISDSMKLAHKEGRAHNIGECRWNNEPSYPEKWLIGILEAEFGLKDGVDYKREYSFSRYSLDFAFPEVKFCLEIDGKQHNQELQRLRDAAKDELLRSKNWIELRRSWDTIFSDPKGYIKELKEYLLTLGIISDPDESTRTELIDLIMNSSYDHIGGLNICDLYDPEIQLIESYDYMGGFKVTDIYSNNRFDHEWRKMMSNAKKGKSHRGFSFRPVTNGEVNKRIRPDLVDEFLRMNPDFHIGQTNK